MPLHQVQADDSSPFSSSSFNLHLPLSLPPSANPAPAQSQESLLQDEMAWFTIRSDSAERSPRAKISRKRRFALLRSYIADWLITIILAAAFFSLDKVPGFRREFSIDDPTLRFPFAEHERIPPVALYLIAVVAPFVLQIVVNLLTVRSLWDFHNGSLGLLLGLTLTGAITQFTKITVGRPRPDVLSRCQPPSGITNPEYKLVSSAICTQTDVAIMRDGWRSFPSGHSSLSFAGLGFLTFYLAGKLHLFDQKGHTTKAWISITPLFGAALVAISRTMDFRHHWQDVFIGSVLGLAMSYFAYRQYYPPLGSSKSHHPFSPRIARSSDEEILPSEGSSNTPILPTSRQGLSGNSMHGGNRESTEVLTHPGGQGVHLGPDHAFGAYPQYRDDDGVEDMQRGEGVRGGEGGHALKSHSRDRSNDLEMDGRIRE